MLRALVLCVALVAACKNEPSRLDPTLKKGAEQDPWAQLTASSSDSGSTTSGGGALDGFDIEGTLKKIAETLEKPGPYEAPEKSEKFDKDKPHWGVLDVGGGIVERQAYSFSLFGGTTGTELRKVVERIRELAKNDKLTGVVMRVASIDISLPDAIELRGALHELRKTGKKLVCHTADASNATYLVLVACDRIGLAPLGSIAITGPAAMPIHVKGLLDKVGVQADFIHVGAYKGAAEPLTRDAPSKEMQETINAILDRHYETTVDIVALDRKLDPGVVRGLIDTALFPSPQALAAKLVDEVVPFEQFRDAAVGEAWTKLELEEDDSGNQLATMFKIGRFVGAMPPEKPFGPHVAVVYALGNIVDGEGGGVLGARQEIASYTLVAALRALTADDSVKAVVLRIDSGGGSAQASELIWRAVADLKAKKPVVVSMSDVAASGGYYIAAGADKIFAHADTLTGSIGVVGGKLAPAGALEKLGVTTYPMGRGKRATMMASMAPWTDEEKAVIRQMMEDVYTTFVSRVAAGRGKKPEEVQPLAQGRVWTGSKAKELGLVDEIGGLDDAIAEASKLAKLDPKADVEIYPPSPTLRDVLKSFGGVSSPIGLDTAVAAAPLAALRAIDPKLADAAERLVRLVMSFRTTQIQTVAILPLVR